MADETTPPPAAPPAVQVDWKQLLAALYAVFPSGILKTAIGVFVGLFASWHYVKSDVSAIVKDAPKGIIEKVLPKKWKPGDAIGKIQFGRFGCTATVMGPIYPGDDVIDVLTAAHCCEKNARGKMILKDGRTFEVQCVARDEKSDVAWLRAQRPEGDLPALLLADVPPPPGAPVWHQGYGVDKPGNVETGILRATTMGGKKCEFVLSVSSGDSGGGIICDETDRVISPVCRTTCLGCTGQVWGGSPSAAAAIRPRRAASIQEPPLANPILENPPADWMGSQG